VQYFFFFFFFFVGFYLVHLQHLIRFPHNSLCIMQILSLKKKYTPIIGYIILSNKIYLLIRNEILYKL
jgi:hypothetical protein